MYELPKPTGEIGGEQDKPPEPGVASFERQGPEIPQEVVGSITSFAGHLAARLGVPPERLTQALIGAVQREMGVATNPGTGITLSVSEGLSPGGTSAEQQMERRRAVEAILATPGISVALYGKFGSDGVSGEAVTGYFDDTLEGPTIWETNGRDVAMSPRGHQNMPFFWGRREPVQTEAGEMLPPFEAVVTEKTRRDAQESPIAFSLTYADTESDDRRPGVTTTCTVAVPPSEQGTIDTIRANSSLMIDLMRRVFPHADRSKGQLKITNAHGKEGILKATVDRIGNLNFIK